jgi:hypothetical protein
VIPWLPGNLCCLAESCHLNEFWCADKLH